MPVDQAPAAPKLDSAIHRRERFHSCGLHADMQIYWNKRKRLHKETVLVWETNMADMTSSEKALYYMC